MAAGAPWPCGHAAPASGATPAAAPKRFWPATPCAGGATRPEGIEAIKAIEVDAGPCMSPFAPCAGAVSRWCAAALAALAARIVVAGGAVCGVGV